MRYAKNETNWSDTKKKKRKTKTERTFMQWDRSQVIWCSIAEKSKKFTLNLIPTNCFCTNANWKSLRKVWELSFREPVWCTNRAPINKKFTSFMICFERRKTKQKQKQNRTKNRNRLRSRKCYCKFVIDVACFFLCVCVAHLFFFFK